MDSPNGQTTILTYLGNSQDRRLEEIHNKFSSGATLSRFEYSYDATGTRKTWTQQAGTNPEQIYDLGHDAVDQLTTATLRTTDPTPTILKRYRYAYDVAENRIGEQIDNASTIAAHNSLNSLTSAQPGGAMLFAGTVNEAATVTVQQKPAEVTADNRFSGSATTTSGTNTVVVTATDPNANTRTNTYEVSLSGSTKTLTYDANGNLTGDGTRTFEWDGANRLITVIQGTNRSEFTYDGWGRRVKIVEKDNGVVTSDRRFLWCGLMICEERTSTGSVTRRFFTQGMEESGTDFFYTRDHLGSVRELNDTSGSVRARYDYDPYGRVTKVSGDKDSVFTFAGYFHHGPSGLELALFRAYDPQLGRWISQDPIGFAGGLNFYSYAQGEPVDGTDPLGLFADGGFTAAMAAEAAALAEGAAVGAGIGLAATIGLAAAALGVGIGIGTLIDQTIVKPWQEGTPPEAPPPQPVPPPPAGQPPSPVQPPTTGEPPSSSTPQTPPAPVSPPGPVTPPIVEPPEESSEEECEEGEEDDECMKKLKDCLENNRQPPGRVKTWGPFKDCGACYRECTQQGGVWPDYKCPE